MPNFATALKSEISRVARKEARSETLGMKKATSQHRSDIVTLKRRIAGLEQLVKRLAKLPNQKLTVESAEDDSPGIRFNAAQLTAQRERLGLTASELARLLGVSYQSIRKWENKISTPRAAQLALIATLDKMGKRLAQSRLAEIDAQK